MKIYYLFLTFFLVFMLNLGTADVPSEENNGNLNVSTESESGSDKKEDEVEGVDGTPEEDGTEHGEEVKEAETTEGGAEEAVTAESGAEEAETTEGGAECGESSQGCKEKEGIIPESIPEIDIIYPNQIPPYIAAVKTKYGTCTGSLIEPNWVITSGSCVWDIDKEDVEVFFGVFDLTDESKIQVKAQAIIVNPRYTPGFLSGNIALIRLQSSVSDQIHIKVERGSWLEGEPLKCVTIGYKDNISFQLQATAVRSEQNCKCLPPSKFACVEESIVDGRCINDKGGPLVCNDKLYGVRCGSYAKAICELLLAEEFPVEDTEDEFYEDIYEDLNSDKTRKVYRPYIWQVNGRTDYLDQEFGDLGKCPNTDSLVAYSYVHHYIDWIDGVFEGIFPMSIPGTISKDKGTKLFRPKFQIRQKSYALNCRSCLQLLLAFLLLCRI